MNYLSESGVKELAEQAFDSHATDCGCKVDYHSLADAARTIIQAECGNDAYRVWNNQVPTHLRARHSAFWRALLALTDGGVVIPR